MGHNQAYFVNDQSKSEVLGHVTVQLLKLISTSVYMCMLYAQKGCFLPYTLPKNIP